MCFKHKVVWRNVTRVARSHGAGGTADAGEETDHETQYGRRRFLGALGAGAVGTTGLAETVTAQDTPVVEVGNDYFDPIGLHVEPGTTVRFELVEGSHSATAYEDRIPGGAAAFDSGTVSRGRFEHTFETPGTYDYYCIPHRSIGMVGRIVVGPPGGPAEEGSIPDGEVPASETIVDRGAVAYGSDVAGSGETGGGMMGRGDHGMWNGHGGWWIGGLPLVGWALGALGVVAGGRYWLGGRDRSGTERDGPAMDTLRRRFERGEIDEETFRRRRERLKSDDDRSSE